MNVKISIHKRPIEARLESIKTWKVPVIVKEDVLRFLDDLELGKVNKGRRISEARRLKYLDLMKVFLEFWNKPIETIDLKDVEEFEKALSASRITTQANKAALHGFDQS